MEKDTLDGDKSSEYGNEQRLSEVNLKKQNIKSVFGSGKGRLAIIMLAGTIIVLLCIGVYNISSRNAPKEPAATATAAMINPPSSQGDVVVTSETEARLRMQAANQQAAEAAQEGKNYLAPPIIRADAANEKVTDGPLGPHQVKTGSDVERDKIIEQNKIAAQTQQANNEAAERAAKAALAAQAFQQRKKEEIDPQMLAALGRTENGQPRSGFATGSYALPERKPEPAAVVTPLSTPTTTQNLGTSLVPKGFLAQAGDGYYCESRTKINTDSPRSEVLADCFSGKLNGATLVGKFEQSKEGASEGFVSITFSLLSVPGRPAIPIQAIAIDDDTGESGLADEVNDHSLRKYGGMAVASVLRGLGKAASVITGTTTVVNNGATSSTQIVTDPMTPGRQAKIAAGEVGISLSDALQRNSDNLKRTVKVGNKKGLRVLFLADVPDDRK